MKLNLEEISDAFAENFAQRGELGASLSVWHAGREVLSLAAGFRDRARTEPWTAQTPVLVWSATKGIAAACALHALANPCRPRLCPPSPPHLLRFPTRRAVACHLDMRVTEIWPEFANAGKSEITFAELLSHRAGLAALSRETSVFDYDEVIRALEEQEPL
ncbi:MAG: beta-lactamase family protein, partial [Gloeobacteraceae cyanobacterium ES-bin-144]|nr:beta-lactamase family protein [Verrucomicrobiales bacterium]